MARKLQEFLTSHNKANAKAATDEQDQCYLQYSMRSISILGLRVLFVCFYPYCES